MKIVYLVLILVLYYILKVNHLEQIFYPVTLFTTFLHEFGHGIFTILFGGVVESLDVNFNGSGVATTGGGIRSITLMGGYIGSAIFGGLLLFSSGRYPTFSKWILRLLASILFFSSLFWFADIFSSLIQIVLGAIFLGLSYIDNKYSSFILQVIGIFSLFHIIQDFNVGPSSDLSKFSFLLPQIVWMYIWGIIVLCIAATSIYFTYLKPEDKQNQNIYQIKLKR